MRLLESFYDNEQANIIRKECSEIVSIFQETNRLLYRGSDHSYREFDFIKHRNDRKTRNTDQYKSDKIDNEFYKLFGWRPRKEGVFVTADSSDAVFYGDFLYIIFPKNGFKFIWSDKIVDMIEANLDNDEEIKKTTLTYTDKYLKNALKSNHEIMIKCDGYYVLHNIRLVDSLILLR